MELALPVNANDTGTNGQLGGARGKGKKAGAGKDQLVEMRFYIPGTTTKKETEGDDAGSDGEEEEQNAATFFYETLIEKAEIGETAGDTIATFLDVLHLTPRYVICVIRTLQEDIRFVDKCAAEVVSISTCTKLPSDSAARRTTTRSSTRPSRSSWCSPSLTICTVCSALA